MDESLTQRRRVRDEGLRVVNRHQKALANYVPAAAVIRRMQALPGFIGRKESVGGFLSLILKTPTQSEKGVGYWETGVISGLLEFVV